MVDAGEKERGARTTVPAPLVAIGQAYRTRVGTPAPAVPLGVMYLTHKMSADQALDATATVTTHICITSFIAWLINIYIVPAERTVVKANFQLFHFLVLIPSDVVRSLAERDAKWAIAGQPVRVLHCQ